VPLLISWWVQRPPAARADIAGKRRLAVKWRRTVEERGDRSATKTRDSMDLMDDRVSKELYMQISRLIAAIKELHERYFAIFDNSNVFFLLP
jgi:hypothetical protein